MAVVRLEKFIMVESGNNHNKCWYIEEHDNGLIRTTWGRVGNTLSTTDKLFGINSSKEYDKLVKSKLKKGYTKLRTIDSASSSSVNNIQKKNLEDIALKEIVFDKADNQIKTMIQVFCQANIHTITSSTNITFNSTTGVFQTPCGVVTLEAINDARNILNKIYDLVKDRDFGYDFIHYTEQYCTIIPQKVHGRLICTKIFRDLKDVQKQNDVLDSLKDSIETIEQMKNSENDANSSEEPKMFNCEIKKITDKKVIDKIKKLYKETHQSIHACRNLKVKTVYEITIDSMKAAYENTKTKWEKLGKELNEQELWHGTKKQNIISIMKNGMIIPPANASHCTGRMFGSDGLYLSDQSTKSLNYAYGWWSGTRDTNCYMFLNKVLMGKSYTPKGWSGCSHIPFGYDSIFAKAGISGVQNNEMVVPPNQVCPEYLIEFDE
ncbi:MAG: hypothetical protein J6J11_09325 [Treponema sp.]|nr:hypothetical protein [Clostridia bacterium]MBP3608500.1 hypothetical protein [Treponema sp.]